MINKKKSIFILSILSILILSSLVIAVVTVPEVIASRKGYIPFKPARNMICTSNFSSGPMQASLDIQGKDRKGNTFVMHVNMNNNKVTDKKSYIIVEGPMYGYYNVNNNMTSINWANGKYIIYKYSKSVFVYVDKKPLVSNLRYK
ncbi:MAG: hypothetical protein WC867_05610 [Candidatus Pacearchaeota archaeon]|jgi:hypothetical protein